MPRTCIAVFCTLVACSSQSIDLESVIGALPVCLPLNPPRCNYDGSWWSLCGLDSGSKRGGAWFVETVP